MPKAQQRQSKHRSKREFVVVIERDEEDWYIASVPALPGCHTQAKSLDELAERIKEAILVFLEAKGETNGEPSLEFIGLQKVTV